MGCEIRTREAYAVELKSTPFDRSGNPIGGNGVTTIFIIHLIFKPFYIRTLQALCIFSIAPSASSSVEIGRYL